jgi:hypothetical protein
MLIQFNNHKVIIQEKKIKVLKIETDKIINYKDEYNKN